VKENGQAPADNFTIACAWCSSILQQGGPLVSHGICGDCLEDVLRNLREQLEAQDGAPSAPHATGLGDD
jgi:hypothetical protein